MSQQTKQTNKCPLRYRRNTLEIALLMNNGLAIYHIFDEVKSFLMFISLVIDIFIDIWALFGLVYFLYFQ
jgi:hypothetical protein